MSNYDIINARVTFKNIPLHKLEKYTFEDIGAAYDAFKEISDVSECLIIQTASRVEVFMVLNLGNEDSPDARTAEGQTLTLNQIKKTWANLTTLDAWDLDHFDQTFEVYKNTEVYEHLLKLACGLESVVVGKDEILNEIKAGITNAKQAKVSGKILNKLFDTTIRMAEKIRESTGIGVGIQSLGDLLVKTAEENAGLDGKKRVLLIGTGEKAALIAKSLNKKDLKYDITSMTLDRATGFSKILGGKPISFEDVMSGFDKFDVVFAATTPDYFIITREKIKRIMDGKKTGTMILDISFPRAVHENTAMIPGIKLMFSDQFAEMDEENAKIRNEKIPAVEKLIEEELPILEATMNRLDTEPVTKDILSGIDSLRNKELKKALEKLGETDENKIKIIEELTKSVVESIVSVPKNKDKQSSEQEKS